MLDIKYETRRRLRDSDCEVILTLAGTYTKMDGNINKVFDMLHPELYYNIKTKREEDRLSVGNCMIIRLDNKKYYIIMFPTTFDLDKNKGSRFDKLDKDMAYDTFVNTYEIMKNIGLDKLKIGAFLNFGVVNREWAESIKEIASSVFISCDFTFYKKL